jgi:hypothetical protein
MAATLVALFAAGFVLKSRMWEEPLKALYTGSPAVESYNVDRNDDRYVITIRLKATPDLAAAYQALDEGTGRILKSTPYTLKVEDRRTPALAEAYRPVNLYVQEALTTGRFAAMGTQVMDEANKAGMTARVDVDSNRVYVQLQDRSGAYLYSVVDRPQPAGAVRYPEGGIGL